MSKGVGEGNEGLLRACQVSGLKSLADSSEVLGAIGSPEWHRTAERTVLAECDQSVIGLLGGVGVPRLESFSKLLEAGCSRLPEFLPLPVDRFGGGSVVRTAGVSRSAQVHNECRKALAGIVVVSQGLLKARKGRLRVRQVARLQGLADGFEGLGPVGLGKGLGIAEGTALPQRDERAVDLLGLVEVASLERPAKLSKVRATILVKTLELLKNRKVGNCLCGHKFSGHYSVRQRKKARLPSLNFIGDPLENFREARQVTDVPRPARIEDGLGSAGRESPTAKG